MSSSWSVTAIIARRSWLGWLGRSCGRPSSRCFEAQVRGADADDVAVVEHVLAVDPPAVDLRAVRAAEVDEHEAAADRTHLGVPAADVGVVHRDGAVRQTADRGDLAAQGDSLAR